MSSKDNETQDYESIYRDFSDDELVYSLAFQWEDFTNEAQVALTSVAEERGISERDVWDYRAKAFAGSEVLTHCVTCGEELRLNSNDLSTGSFECPECGTVQKVTFASLRVKGTKTPVAERLTNGAFADKEVPKGIGGWLILIGIGLSIGALLSVVALWVSVSDGILVDILFNLVDLVIVVFLLYLFATEKRLFPPFYIAFLSLWALISLAVACSPEPPNGSFRDAAFGILGGAVWISYMLVSKRVKATFTNRLWTRQSSQQESEQLSTVSILRTNLRTIILVISYVGWIGCAVVLWFFYMSALTEWLGYVGTVLAFVAAPGVVVFPIIYWIVEGHFPVLYFVLIGVALVFGFIAGLASPDD